MDTTRLKVFGVFLGLSLMWPSYALAHAATNSSVLLNGNALFSFTTEHFFLQTDRYVYKIRKDVLPSQLIDRLDEASLQNELVHVSIPRSAIVFLWPAKLEKSRGSGERDFTKLAKDLKSSVQTKNGQVTLTGSIALSFSEGSFLVEVDSAVYQIKKSALTSTQLLQLSGIGIGGRVTATVPQNAIELSWSFRQQPNRKRVTIQIPDGVRTSEGEVLVSGTVLYSFNDPLVLIQSDEVIYQMDRSLLTTQTPDALNVPGSKIQVTAPIAAVQFAWSVVGGDVTFGQ